MTDRGEKIVSLAREMLLADAEGLSPAPCGCEATRNDAGAFMPTAFLRGSSFKAVCLALMLGAMASGATVHAIDESNRPANRYEKVEIEALLFYTTQQKALNADELRRQLTLQLELQTLDFMTHADYVIARDYLLSRLP